MAFLISLRLCTVVLVSVPEVLLIYYEDFSKVKSSIGALSTFEVNKNQFLVGEYLISSRNRITVTDTLTSQNFFSRFVHFLVGENLMRSRHRHANVYINKH